MNMRLVNKADRIRSCVCVIQDYLFAGGINRGVTDPELADILKGRRYGRTIVSAAMMILEDMFGSALHGYEHNEQLRRV